MAWFFPYHRYHLNHTVILVVAHHWKNWNLFFNWQIFSNRPKTRNQTLTSIFLVILRHHLQPPAQMYHFDRKSMKLYVVIVLNPYVALKDFWAKNVKLKDIPLRWHANCLRSDSRSLLSLVPRRSFNDRRLNEPPAGAWAWVPRRSKNGLTFASGRLCWIPVILLFD